jgi:hypothetical protein
MSMCHGCGAGNDHGIVRAPLPDARVVLCLRSFDVTRVKLPRSVGLLCAGLDRHAADKARVEAVRIAVMTASNSWTEFAVAFLRTRSAHLEHEAAKAGLKGLVPADAHQAFGHGIRAKRSKSGAISFDLLAVEDEHAARQ